MSTPETKDRIISAAERLFAERGYAGTSLRTVTSEAGVNLAAVHYHFGTKDALLRAVFDRRVGPVNKQRLQRLDELERQAGADGPELEDILAAFLLPIMDLKRDLEGEGVVWSRFIGRIYSEPVEVVEKLLLDQFEEVGRRFATALADALPQLSTGEVIERLQFTIGVMSHTLIDLHKVVLPPEDRQEIGPATVPRMIRFIAAGFRAPSVDHDAVAAARQLPHMSAP